MLRDESGSSDSLFTRNTHLWPNKHDLLLSELTIRCRLLLPVEIRQPKFRFLYIEKLSSQSTEEICLFHDPYELVLLFVHGSHGRRIR